MNDLCPATSEGFEQTYGNRCELGRGHYGDHRVGNKRWMQVTSDHLKAALDDTIEPLFCPSCMPACIKCPCEFSCKEETCKCACSE